MHLDLWTLALQAINAAVLIWLLARFLFRPVRAMIDQRRQAAEALLADADAARARAEADAAEIAHQRAGFAATGEQILAEAHARAAADAAALRDQAVQAAERMRQDVAAGIAQERSAMQASIAVEAAELAVSIARRLVARVPEEAVTEALLRDLAERVAGLAENERDRLAAAPLEIVTAAPLNPQEQSACRTWLGMALDGRWQAGRAAPPPPLAGLSRGADQGRGQGAEPDPPDQASRDFPLPSHLDPLRGSSPQGEGTSVIVWAAPPQSAPSPPLRITFRVDPALLAGVELRAPHTLIRNHWQADLERIAQELRPDVAHDTRPARLA
jgi:F-type H+-transporting ATPase subunit b